MSSVEKLQISGIRSFGSNHDEKQTIEFKSPVTLILGANGCGKTTIIECLKYALTAELPPGSNKGQSFVHDPKVARSIESLGQVKLRVANQQGQKFTVSRSVKCEKKMGGDLKFSGLATTIVVTDPKTGKEEQLTNRCIDASNEMCIAMGVSRAIINNVIFCHQEDSSWPLDEPKKLKEKFDAIFGTTEYNKAIDKINKMAKSYNESIRTKSAELIYLKKFKSDTESKQLELEETERKYELLNKTIAEVDAQLVPIKDRLLKIREVEINYSKMYQQKVECTTQLTSIDEQESSLKKKIKKLFEGSATMLQGEISSFEDDMKVKKSNLTQLDILMNSLKVTEKKINTNLSDLEKRRTKLSYQRQQEQEYISERMDKIKELCEQLGLPNECDSQSSDESIKDGLNKIKIALKREDKSLKELSKGYDIEETEQQKVIDKLRESKAAIENEIQTKVKQISSFETEVKKLDDEIKSVQKSAEKLHALSEKVKKINDEYETISKKVNLDQMKETIANKRLNRDKLQDNLEAIDEELAFLNSISSVTAQIQDKKQQLESREIEVRRIRSKHSANLKTLFKDRVPDANYKRSVDKLHLQLQNEINEMGKEVGKCLTRKAQIETNRTNVRNDLMKIEKEKKDNTEEIYNHCGSAEFKDVLTKLKEKIDKMQLDYGASKSSEVLFKKYIQEMESEPCCPLCHTQMSTRGISTLSDELSDEIGRLPGIIAKSEKALKESQMKYEKLLTLQPMIERIEFLEKEIPLREQNLKKIEDQLTAVVTEMEDLEMSQLEPANNLKTVNSLIGDMSLLDEAQKEVTLLESLITSLEANIPQRPSTMTETMTLEEAKTKRTSTNAELRNERCQIDGLQKKFEGYTNNLNTLRDQRNQLKEEEIKLKEGIQALSQKKDRQVEVKEKIRATQLEKKQCQDKLPSLDGELKTASNKKDATRLANRQTHSLAQSKLNAMENIDSEIAKLTTQINDLAVQNIASQIEEVKASLLSYQEERKEKAKEMEECVEKIDKLREEISTQELNERDLFDNRDLKKLQEHRVQLQKKYDNLVKDFGDQDYKTVIKEKEQLIIQQDGMYDKKSRKKGQVNELQNQVSKLKETLNLPEYKDAIKNYRYTLYECEALKCVQHDLQEYQVALEWALIKHHSEKMEKINQLVREYWRSIYQGNDIDFIQIQTDDFEKSTTKKRNYNYRVVQSKNDVELDMRGRCSAGQRVLACLIIRIALAETFSSNCGVLALDEPTTNLDRANIVSLCEVLSRVIEERQSQTNFMFIIITHDEEFVNSLGNIDSYYKVFRNLQGKSEIEKIQCR